MKSIVSLDLDKKEGIAPKSWTKWKKRCLSCPLSSGLTWCYPGDMFIGQMTKKQCPFLNGSYGERVERPGFVFVDYLIIMTKDLDYKLHKCHVRLVYNKYFTLHDLECYSIFDTRDFKPILIRSRDLQVIIVKLKNGWKKIFNRNI